MKKNISFIKSLIVIGLIIIFVLLINKFNIFKGYGPNEIKTFINSKGAMAPIIYVVILSLLPLLLFPDSVLVIAGGMLFGLWQGVVLTTIGSLLGGIIAFLISRILGTAVVKKILKRDIVIFNGKNTMNAFFLILTMRLIPLFPFKVVSYSAGLTDMKLRDYALATAIGSLPGIIVYTNVGDKTNAFGSKGFYISIGLLIVLFVLSFMLKKVYKNKLSKSKD